MNFLSLRPGETVAWGGRPATIRLFDADLVVLMFDDGKFLNCARTDVYQAYQRGELIPIEPIRSVRVAVEVTQTQWAEWHRRLVYLQALDQERYPHSENARESVIELIASRSNDQSPPGKSTLSRWYKEWIANGKSTIPAKRTSNGGRRRSKLPSEVLDLMQEVIRDAYMVRHGPTKISAYHAFKNRYTERGYTRPCPSERTFRREISAVNRFDMLEAREGRSVAREAERVAANAIEPSFPLERVEVDSLHLNLGLLNAEGHFAGKVVIHLALDVFSRSVLGFAIHVGPGKEDSAAIIHAMRYAISSKRDQQYPMCGLPYEIIHDAGSGYLDATTQTFYANIGAQLNTTPVRAGWLKPFVERFISTFRDGFAKNIDGYLGKRDPKKYTDDTIAKSAHWNVQEFRALVYDYIVNHYHNEPHRGLMNNTPRKVWDEGVSKNPPVLPADMRDLTLLRGQRVRRALTRTKGVEHLYERFHSTDLVMLYDRLCKDPIGKQSIGVDLLVDPLDAGAVSVIDPESGDLIEASNVRTKHTGISFAEINATRYANKRANGTVGSFNPEERIEKIRKKRNKCGPDVPLDSDEVPINLDSLFTGELNGDEANCSKTTNSTPSDEDLPRIRLSETR